MHRSRSAVHLAPPGSGRNSPASHHPPLTSLDTRPSSRASCSFKSKDDDVGAAMAAVRRAVRSKQWTSAYMDANTSASSPCLWDAGHLDAEDQEEREEAERQRRLESQEALLRTAMTCRNLASLRKAIDNAAAQGLPATVVDEARALLRLETQVQNAVAEGTLGNIRTAVSEVHRCRALASCPRQPPFALHQELEYWSEKKGDWIRCKVTDTSSDGKILVSLKKKAEHWFSLSSQQKKFQVVDTDLAAAASQVNLDAATALLDKADDLQAALRSKEVSTIKAVVARARGDKCLGELVSRAETFLQEASRRRCADEAEPVDVSCDAAAAWQAAKKSIRNALRAESDRAWAEAAGKGWGDLEWDLLVESLAALEKSFDSTDLGSLEQSINKLEDGDLDVGAAVVQEARQALRALESQRVELHKAMKDGDIDTMRTAIRFSRQLLLPETLVCETRVMLDLALGLDQAIKSQDPSLLASTLAQMEGEASAMALQHKARAILSATEVLQQALRGRDVEAIEKAMCAALDEGFSGALVDQARQLLVQDMVEKKRKEESARKEARLRAAINDADVQALRTVLEGMKKEHSLPEELIAKARTMVEIGTALEAAMKAQDQRALEAALARAEREGFEMPCVQQARVVVRASEALQVAMQSSDISAIEEAIRRAGAEGVPAALLAQARKAIVDCASEALHKAMQGNDIQAIEEALRSADPSRVPAALLAKARQAIVDRSSEALERAMQNDDVGAIEEAIRNAGANGVPEALLAKARQVKMDRASEALKAAMKSGDASAIEEAVRQAGANGVPPALLAKAQQVIAKRASDALEAALQGDDVGAIEEAIRKADASGVPPALLEKARQVIIGRASEALQAVLQGDDLDAIEEAIRLADANGVPAALLAEARQKFEAEVAKREREKRRASFLSELEAMCQSKDTMAMRAAIAEGEELGFQGELDRLRQELEETLAQMRERAMKFRQEQEKLASEFRSAKEANDIGGAILTAQWRAAMAETAKPFVFSEEEEISRMKQQKR